MLTIYIPAQEGWDEEKERFVEYRNARTIQLEHSLVSISKWESITEKTFLSNKNISMDETLLYIKCMTITQNVDDDVYSRLTDKNIEEINAYIGKKMSALYFLKGEKNNGAQESITSEVIYYWMIALNIPFECQKWHLNRLLALIQVCNVKNKTGNVSKKDLMARSRAINNARRHKMNGGSKP